MQAMAEDLSAYRKSYEQGALTVSGSKKNPFDQFKNWFKEVEDSKGIEEVNAMTISTLGPDNFPKNRIVLLKHYDEAGFVFYTNYDSEKGKAIASNPNVCISFFWPNLERQVIKGIAKKVSQKQSDDYFHSRPVGSQLGAIASPQSKVIPHREFLEERLKNLKNQFDDKTIPKPENWGGYRVEPQEFEFWQGRPNRLHDRLRYLSKNGLWERERLAP